jgi:hypothetical protein
MDNTVHKRICILYTLHNITVIKSRTMKYANNAACGNEVRNMC